MNFLNLLPQKQTFAQQSFNSLKEKMVAILKKNRQGMEFKKNQDIEVKFEQSEDTHMQINVSKNKIFIGWLSYPNRKIKTISTSIFFERNKLFVYKNTDGDYIHSALQSTTHYTSSNSNKSEDITKLEITTPDQLNALVKEIEKIFEK